MEWVGREEKNVKPIASQPNSNSSLPLPVGTQTYVDRLFAIVTPILNAKSTGLGQSLSPIESKLYELAVGNLCHYLNAGAVRIGGKNE